MSVIVENEEGQILLLCKGADRLVKKLSVTLNDCECLYVSFVFHPIDHPEVIFSCSVMFERLAKNGREFEEKTMEHVHEYADAGLRTLILAYRELDAEEYKDFDRKFSKAKNLVSADRETVIEEVSDNIEKNLILLGATAVEDKLQIGVS